MMNKIFPVLLLFFMGSLTAQNFIVTKSSSDNIVQSAVSVDTVNILAIMVNFQADRDGATFGNGKFGSVYSSDYGSTIIDPLPHDRQYFEDHLLFAQNYFKKVSNDNLNINYFVLPDTFSVSQTMRNYAPEPNSDDFTNLGNFALEAWTMASQMYPGFDFSEYDLFTIFHAGVGNDIDLPGSIGNERDLPSIYLSHTSFEKIFGNDYEGIPVMSGNFFITNTLILPETESRELTYVDGSVQLVEFSINGYLAASIGSHLGVPDLFDTETGLSVIGRFGLMDGQGIFAYNGTYPPEPSPWTKIYLGWAEPVTVELENADVTVVTKLAAEVGDTVIIKVPLNSDEYFLIENRIRDANNDGSIVTYKSGGEIRTTTFTDDVDGYRSFDVDSLEGIIIDVDEYDWALPGNGNVIWHINESVIQNNLNENKVNIDKNNRGIDIEEADGIQDIGETFTSILGDEIVGEGTEEDFWHSDNQGRFFENRFAKDTRPDTRSNSGANSLITIKDFSEIDNRMSFSVEFGDSIIKPLFSTEISSLASVEYLSSIEFNGEVYFFIGRSGEGDTDLIIATKDSVVIELTGFSNFKPAILIENDVLHVYGNGSDNKLNYWLTDGSQTFSGFVNIPQSISFPIVANNLNRQQPEICFGTYQGSIYKFNLAGLPDILPQVKDSIQFGGQFTINGLVCYGDFYAAISVDNSLGPLAQPFYFSSLGDIDFTGEDLRNLLLTKDQNGELISVVSTAENIFHIISNGNIVTSFNGSLQENSNYLSIGDLKQDGNICLVTNGSDNINVYSLNGSSLDNFPFPGYEAGFSPLIADIEGNSNAEIISDFMSITAISASTGKVIDGFPFTADQILEANPVLFVYDNKINIATVAWIDNNILLKAWSISSAVGNIYWSEEYGNPQNNAFVDAAENTNRINEFFPTERAYNYPNPVYGGETFIRYYVAEDSRINIKIFDLAGDYVAELTDEAQGGMDNETIWDVTNVQSGVYLARVEATADSGNSEFAIIKIAVVK